MNTELYADGETLCCVTCNKALQTEIWNDSFWQYLAILLVIVALLACAVLAMRYVYRRRMNRYRAILNPAPLVTVGLVLGIGMGAFSMTSV
jgi:vancomycin permeability regulator SanA